MPIRIQNDLPAKEILENENIFVMDEDRAIHQDIRPLKVIILNVMPRHCQPLFNTILNPNPTIRYSSNYLNHSILPHKP